LGRRPLYLTWCESHTPEKISGSRYVTVVDGVVTHDAATATTDTLRAQVILQRDVLMRMNIAIPTVLLYLAETAAINGGVMTAAQRTVPAATALQYAIYFRALYRILIDNPNPATVVWPTPPTAIIESLSH
jgi:hypothetical protein